MIKAVPKAHVLYPTLSQGYSAINVVYLKGVLAQLKAVEQRAATIETDAPDNMQDEPRWKALTRDIADCYNQLRKLHNQYHTCKTQQEYADVANRMKAAWESAQKAIQSRKAYQIGGEDALQADGELPTDPVALLRKLNSLRARRSQLRKVLEGLLHSGGDQKEKGKSEVKLKEVENLIGLAEQKMANNG
jgi:hypothetical protein